MNPDLIQTTKNNLMKRSPNTRYVVAQGPHFQDGSYWFSDIVVPHNLGYAPVFRAYYEPWGDGKITAAINGSGSGLDNPPYDFSGAPAGPSLVANCDENNLYLSLMYTDATKAGNTYPVYWVIYEDYNLESA